MDPAYYRHPNPNDVEDAAYDFIEQELGRHFWRKNWHNWRKNPKLPDRLKTWLRNSSRQTDPQAVVAFLDRMAATRTGTWQ